VAAPSLILTSWSTLARLHAGLVPTYNNTMNRWWIWIACSHNAVNSSSQQRRWRLDQNRMIRKNSVLKSGQSDLDLSITNVADYVTAWDCDCTQSKHCIHICKWCGCNCIHELLQYLQNIHIAARVLNKTQCFWLVRWHNRFYYYWNCNVTAIEATLAACDHDSLHCHGLSHDRYLKFWLCPPYRFDYRFEPQFKLIQYCIEYYSHYVLFDMLK